LARISDKSIHVPSTMRLLRLLNATTCERGDQCFEYDADTGRSCRISKQVRRSPAYGLALCDACAKISSMNGNHCNYYVLRRHDRLKQVSYNWRLLTYPFVEASTGEKAGPVVTAIQYKQARARSDIESRSLDKLFESMDEVVSAEDTTRAETFLAAYDEAKVDLASYKEHKAEKARKEYWKNVCKRREVSRALLATFESLLDGYEHKDVILEYEWDQYCEWVPDFAMKPVNQLVGMMFRRQSSSNKNTRKKVAETRQFFDSLESAGFLNGQNFLTFLLSSDQQRYMLALYEYCSSVFGENDALLKGLSRRRIDDFVRLVREQKYFDALILAFDDDNSHFKQAFVRHVTGNNNDQHQTSLARRVWDRHVRRFYRFRNETDWRTLFKTCRREYLSLRRSALFYLLKSKTMALLARSGSPRGLTAAQAVDKMYDDDRSHQLLLERNYARLLALHTRYFERGV